MRTSNSIIRATKKLFFDRLFTDPYFANIQGYVRIPKSVRTAIMAKTYQAKGTFFLVGECRLHVPNPDTPGPYFDSGTIAMEFLENVEVNEGLGLPDVDEVGEKAMELLQDYTPEGGAGTATVSGWSEDEDGDLSVRRFLVDFPFGFCPVQQPVLSPIVITPAGAVGGAYPMAVTLAMANPVPGAAIYFTLDDSNPTPRGPGSQFYSPLVPVELGNNQDLQLADGQILMTGNQVIIPAAGTRLKARAYLGGYQSPMPTEALFT